MKYLGNLTNRMTLITNYDVNFTITDVRGNKTIQTTDGQSIGQISADIGNISETCPIFHCIIAFSVTISEKLSFLFGKLNLYRNQLSKDFFG